MAVVADTNEQATAVGIGKGGHGTRQLAGISDTVLEVLLLVLALADQAEKKSSIVHVNCDFSAIYVDTRGSLYSDIYAVGLLDFAHHEGALDGAHGVDVAKFVEHELLVLFHIAGAYL